MNMTVRAQEWEQRKIIRLHFGGIMCLWLAGYVWFDRAPDILPRSLWPSNA